MSKIRHELKTWPEYFIHIWDGSKTFELRKNDRDFKVGDDLWLKEYDHNIAGGYTGNCLIAEITHILKGGVFGLDEDYCIISFKR